MSDSLLAVSLIALSVSPPVEPPNWLEEAFSFWDHFAREDATEDKLQGEMTEPERVSELTETPKIETQKPVSISPTSGAQLYQQRMMALKAGTLHTRIKPGQLEDSWEKVQTQPTYTQWKSLLQQEAKAIAKGQGQNRLNLLVGDSLSLWYPSSDLPQGSFWLNQSISGENTSQILQRLDYFQETRPQTIYVMAGINDLRQGTDPLVVVKNIRAIAQQLKQDHPQAKIILQSILPTQDETLNVKIRPLNRAIVEIAETEKIYYLDLHASFVNPQGQIPDNLTTDGIHLSPQGYSLWRNILNPVHQWLNNDGNWSNV